MSSDGSKAIILLKANSLVFARVKDERPLTAAQARKEYVEIQLLEDLFLNHSKRQHAFLEECSCYVKDLNQKAVSVNHAYTLISTEFEIGRRAKGGNVFNKVYVRGHADGLKPLRTLRASALASIPRPVPDPVRPIRDLGPIAHILNDVLYDEALFVELIHKWIDRCELLTGKTAYSSERKAGRLFFFYQSVFNQYKDWLRTANLEPLINRWSAKLQHSIAGTWSGFFLDETESLMGEESNLAAMVVAACKHNEGPDRVRELEGWIRARYKQNG